MMRRNAEDVEKFRDELVAKARARPRSRSTTHAGRSRTRRPGGERGQDMAADLAIEIAEKLLNERSTTDPARPGRPVHGRGLAAPPVSAPRPEPKV